MTGEHSTIELITSSGACTNKKLISRVSWSNLPHSQSQNDDFRTAQYHKVYRTLPDIKIQYLSHEKNKHSGHFPPDRWFIQAFAIK